MSKINDVEKLINEGKSCKECRELGYGESTYYRAKGRTTANEKKPEKQDSENVPVGGGAEEVGNNADTLVNSTDGVISSDSSDNKEVETVKPKAKPKKVTSKKRAPSESKGNSKGMNSNSNNNNNLKPKEVKSSWKKKILIAVGLLSLAGIMSLFLRARQPAQEVETVSPPSQNRRIPKTSVHRLKR